ncbi:hypothetical protein [Labilibaculum euxinus]
MKKLDLKQMEKVNGGNRCDRLENRFWRNFGTARGNDIMEKMLKIC